MKIALKYIGAFIFISCVYFIHQHRLSQGVEAGARIHQDLIFKLLQDPNLFLNELDGLPIEVRKVLAERPELYKMVKSHQKKMTEAKPKSI